MNAFCKLLATLIMAGNSCSLMLFAGSGGEETGTINSCSLMIQKSDTIVENRKTLSDTSTKFLIEINGGFSYLTGSTKDDVKLMTRMGLTEEQAEDYYDQLAWGYHLGASVKYLFGSFWSAGLKYKFFSTNGTIYGLLDPQDGIHLYYDKISEKVYTNYAGLMICRDNLFKTGKVRLNAGISAGLCMYRSENFQLLSAGLIRGMALAFDPSVGIEFVLCRSLACVVNCQYFLSRLIKVTVDNGTSKRTYDLDKENYENLSRLDLGFGIILKL